MSTPATSMLAHRVNHSHSTENKSDSAFDSRRSTPATLTLACLFLVKNAIWPESQLKTSLIGQSLSISNDKIANMRRLDMRILEWDENDLLYCLEVNPTVKNDGLEFHYAVHNGGLSLFLVVIPHRRLVTFSLFQESHTIPITSFSLLVASGVSFEKDKRGEHLRFSSCRFVTDPDTYEDEALQEDESYKKAFDLSVALFVKPQIRIKFD